MTRHVVAHDGTRHPFGFECLHCGGLLAVSLPVSVDEFGAAANAFVVKHRDCPAPAAAAPAPSRDWPEDAADENGSYSCLCTICKQWFTGHKRRVACKACAGGRR